MSQTSLPNCTESTALELRAHHLLCALTFRAKGYGSDFVREFDGIVQQLIAGHPVKLTRHSDSLCQSGQDCGLCEAEESAKRDGLALTAINQTLDIDGEQTPFSLCTERLEILRRAFADETLRQACDGCAWVTFCSSTATDNFRRAQLQLSA